MSKPAVFEIHPGLVLKGQLSMVKDIVLTGKFEGDLKTLGCLTVAEGGAVIGSIESGALVLEPGHLVDAKIKVAAPPKTKTKPQDERKSLPGGGPSWATRFQKIKELALGRK